MTAQTKEPTAKAKAASIAYLPGSNVSTRFVLVTPDEATLYLKANTRNRHLRDRYAKRLASDMATGRYQITHQGIAFDEDGVMLDGQHRCEAIIMSREPQWMMVTCGLPRRTQIVMDAGTIRQTHDFVEGPYASLRSAAARLMLSIANTDGKVSLRSLQYDSQAATRAGITDYLPLVDDRLAGFAALAQAAHVNTSHVGPSAILTAAATFPHTGHAFLTGIATMEGLTAGDPRKALLRFRGGAAARRTQSVGTMAALKAAKAFDRNKSLSVVKVSPTEVVQVPYVPATN